MNFTAEVVERLPPTARALVELARDGSRREWTFAQVGDSAARLAGALEARGIGRGDVVMTLIGNRPEWVLSMLACFRIGAVVLPCTEQLRAHDLRLRIEATRPSVILADERDRAELERAAPECPVVLLPDETLFAGERAPAVELGEADPCLITFTSGTAGEALNPEVLRAWREATGIEVRDGYGQTETGQLTGAPVGVPAREGSMGRALPGVELAVSDGELVAQPRSVPTFFLGYLGEGV